MKDYLESYLSDKNWHIIENSWDPKMQAVRESHFALGNGYMCSRGVLEENPYDSYAGTYIAGLFDNTGAQVIELVNAPNPFYFKIVSQGEKLDNVAMDVLEHKRMLDMRKGLLYRKTIFSNSQKKRFSYESLRFISMSDKHLGVMRIYLTPLDGTASFTIQNGIDTSVTNKGVLTEGKKKHFYITDVSKIGHNTYTSVQTFQHNIHIGCASHLMVKHKKNRFCVSQPVFKLKLKKGETACFTKIFSLYTSRRFDPTDLKRVAVNALKRKEKMGFEKLIKNDTSAWNRRWKIADVEIKGDKDVEKALRFNIYHMLICAPEREGQASIGARTLTGEGYRGHVFWDTEIFILPFFIYNFPKIARNILMYRYLRLDEARKIAKDRGYKGALFPWESADSGQDATPTWAKDLDGSIIQIFTMQQEQHIDADIAYGICHYFDVTKDIDFFLNYGVEILFETAKFWVSRMELNNKTRKYEIKCVIGPDEFHEDVNNSVFTNLMARWNLLRAYAAYTMVKEKKPALLKRLLKKTKLKEGELKSWRRIAVNIRFPYSKKRRLIEAFDGYFKKKDVPIVELDKNFMPVFPPGITPRNVNTTQLVKQADVVMLLYLLSDLFSFDEKKRNFSYYEKRTLHKSSLSICSHSIIASEIGNQEKAFLYFFNSLMTDFKDTHGNTSEGIHAASLGGTWQAVINGFAGMRIKNGTLNFNPKLPDRWQGIQFTVNWHNYYLRISALSDSIRIAYYTKKPKEPIFVRVFGILRQLKPNVINEFHKRKKKK